MELRHLVFIGIVIIVALGIWVANGRRKKMPKVESPVDYEKGPQNKGPPYL